MDDEWEEEEQYVVVELSGVANRDFLSGCNTCKIWDIDSEKPIMQVGGLVFAGEYDESLGTYAMFEEKEKDQSQKNPEISYRAHTTKKLKMQRIFITDNKEAEKSTEAEEKDEQKNTSSPANVEESQTQQEVSEVHMETVNSEDSIVD